MAFGGSLRNCCLRAPRTHILILGLQTKRRNSIVSLLLFPLAKDESVRKMMREIEHLSEDNAKIQKIIDIMNSIR